jgi:hypothetical protein
MVTSNIMKKKPSRRYGTVYTICVVKKDLVLNNQLSSRLVGSTLQRIQVDT